MTSVLRVLCLFSSAHLRGASFFAAREGGWATEIDAGRCEFVPLVVDAEMPTLATSGLFAAASVLCHPADLAEPLLDAMRAGAASFARAGVPLELVPAEAPVSVIEWLGAHAPELVPLCQPDGEVRPTSPTWWRERARRHLQRGTAEPRAAVPEDLRGELREFVARRGW
jgi:hypothetical protein